ncbi:DinB/UmuC family translesion DNA polymerase [Streptomyces microflavus]|uniref:DinB/UmuC family translesion DNA polymerase n=1 Tax=Streptomyces microflavus TaxID=1919 RepID=UPI003F4D3416
MPQVGTRLRILHLRCPADVDPQVYRLLLGLVAEVTPVVQALPPSALVADVSGSLRYFDRDPSGLARIIRTRALARNGLDVKIGIVATWALAAMASNESGPGGIRTVGAHPRGHRSVPVPAAGRGAVRHRPRPGPHPDRARRPHHRHPRHPPGIDRPAHPRRPHRTPPPRTSQGHRPPRRRPHPPPLPYSTSAQRRFTIDTLDPTAVRAALLSLAVELGDRLRNRQQAARTVTLTVTLGGHSQITRSHRLESGPSAHTDDLRQTLYDLYADCGSQRARIRAVTGG